MPRSDEAPRAYPEPAPAADPRARRAGPAEAATNEPLGRDDRPDVGLAQSGTGEDAVIRRETEI